MTFCVMTFKEAIDAAPQPVNRAYRPGKQALESRHRGKVSCADSRRLTGSIFLDSALAQVRGYTNKPRWDYGLGYKPENGRERAIWVEVHSATTREVSAVLKKLQWLRDWLNSEAEQLKKMTFLAKDDIRFVWIASSSVKIPKNSPQFRRLNQSGISIPQKHLSLP